MSPNPAYLEAQWKDYRNRKRLFFFAVISFPISVVIGAFLSYYFQVSWLSFAPAVIFAIDFIATANYVYLFACPFCGKHFPLAYSGVARSGSAASIVVKQWAEMPNYAISVSSFASGTSAP